MYIDLSMPVSEKTVVFPGDALPKFELSGTFESVGCVDHVMHIGNHLGTHIDAPGHMVEGGKWLREIPIDRFVAQAVCIDARGQKALDFDLLNDVQITTGMAVLLYTGAGDKYTEQSYAEDYPPITPALAQALIDKGVSMVGVDMISFDHDEPFPIHVALLKQEILLIENLVNLQAVVGKTFKLYALPINLELEAAPARVIAELA